MPTEQQVEAVALATELRVAATGLDAAGWRDERHSQELCEAGLLCERAADMIERLATPSVQEPGEPVAWRVLRGGAWRVFNVEPTTGLFPGIEPLYAHPAPSAAAPAEDGEVERLQFELARSQRETAGVREYAAELSRDLDQAVEEIDASEARATAAEARIAELTEALQGMVEAWEDFPTARLSLHDDTMQWASESMRPAATRADAALTTSEEVG